MMRTACVLVMCVPAMGALAQVSAFDTFNGNAGPNVYNFGGSNPSLPTRLAWQFTAAAGGEVTSVTFAAYRTSGLTTPASVVFYSANGSLVGSSLGSAGVVLPLGGLSPPVTVATQGVTLTAGQDYFISLELPQFVAANWIIFGPPLVPGPQAAWIGGAWTYFSAPEVYYPAFRVTVPGPGAMGVAGVAGGVAVVGRRRRV